MGSILFSMVLTWFSLHPIHVSITDVNLDEDRKALEFSSKVFLDDMEAHLRLERSEPFLDITALPKTLSLDALIEPYFNERISVSINGKAKEVDYVGAEIDGDVIYLYFQVLQVKKLKALTIENRILTDLYDDQVNMMHFKLPNGKLKSLRTTPDTPEGTLEFN